MKKVHPSILFIPVVIFIIIQITLRKWWPGLWQNLYDDWANFAYYSMYFIAGFTISAFPQIEAVLHNQWKQMLIAGFFSIAFLGVFDIISYRVPVEIKWGVTAPAGYFTVMGMMGFSYHFLSFTNQYLEWLAESALPVYILHQCSIVLPGYLILQLPLEIAAKYFILIAIAVISTLTVYQHVVKRFILTRFLFGMK